MREEQDVHVLKFQFRTLARTLPRLEKAVQMSGNPFSGLAVPKLRHAPALAARRQKLPDPAPQRIWRGADQLVGAFGDGDGPLGVLADRQARNAERGRLLLHAAAVGDGELRFRA